MTQRIANPCTPVRFRYSPPFKINELARFVRTRHRASKHSSKHSVFVLFACSGLQASHAAIPTASVGNGFRELARLGARYAARSLSTCWALRLNSEPPSRFSAAEPRPFGISPSPPSSGGEARLRRAPFYSPQLDQGDAQLASIALVGCLSPPFLLLPERRRHGYSPLDGHTVLVTPLTK